MEHIQSFNFKRILHLMQKNIYENGKSVGITLITVFGLFFFIMLMNAFYGGDAWRNLETFYYIGFFITGLFISGMAFSAFRNKEKTMAWITVPASITEKFISEWLLSTIGFIFLYTTLFYVFNLLIYTLTGMFGISIDIINIFTGQTLTYFLHYLIGQSILLAGAATFKKVPLFFTISTLFVFSLFLVFYNSFLFLAVKGQYENLLYINNLNVNAANTPMMHEDFQNFYLLKIPEYMYYYVMAPVLWIYTWFKLKEKEA